MDRMSRIKEDAESAQTLLLFILSILLISSALLFEVTRHRSARCSLRPRLSCFFY
jgi:hypothetical protein